MRALASLQSLLDEMFGVHQLAPTQQVLLVGGTKCSLNVEIVGIGNFNRDGERDLPGLDCTQQSLLAFLEKMNDAL